MFEQKQRGIALYLALVILSSLTIALLAAVAILISQTKIIYALGDSVAAFYAADTGAEQMLDMVYDPATPYTPIASDCPIGFTDLGETEYSVCVVSVVSLNGTTKAKIYSTGTYKKTNTTRRIELEITF